MGRQSEPEASLLSGAIRGQGRTPVFRRYFAAVAAVIAALAVAFLVVPVSGPENVDLVFLIFVIATAIRFGLGPSLAASVLSLLAFNFFFVTPVHTFEVAEPAHLTALFFFMVVALVTSQLAAHARSQALESRRRADETEALYAFSRRISQLDQLDDLIRATEQRIASMLSLRTVVLLREPDGEARSRVADEGLEPINPIDLATVQASWSRDLGSRTALRAGGWLYVPLRTSNGVVGSIGVSRDWRAGPLTKEERQLLGALADQAAVAIERVRLATERDEARVVSERERLRSTLFASVSHDLKTPLASITGAVTALRQYSDLYDQQARDDLAAMIQDEAERLARFVGNLLDMARLEADGVSPNLQPVDLGEMTGAALERTGSLLGSFNVDVTIDPNLPMLRLDPVLFEQVLVNLLDNAAKYAPAGSLIAIEAHHEGDCVLMSVMDQGAGIPPQDIERVFDKFYRSDEGDRRRGGTGLGLAICRGFMQAMDCNITVANAVPPATGAIFTLSFPGSALAAALPHGGILE